MRQLTDLRHNVKQPIQHTVDQSKPVSGWARCLDCDFVGLKTEFKAAQTGEDTYEPVCPSCHSLDVVVL